MKLTIFLIIMLFQFYTYISLAQCGSTLNCPIDKKYNYIFCNSTTNQIMSKCSVNPNAEIEPWSVMKITLPVCLNFYDSGPSRVEMQTMTGGYQDVFRKEYVQDELNKAAFSWNCLCGKENLPCSSKINVYFMYRPQDFPPNPSSTVARLSPVVSGNTCQSKVNKNCNDQLDQQTIIRINNCKEFTGTDPSNSKKKKFFINDKYFDDNPNYFEDNFYDDQRPIIY